MIPTVEATYQPLDLSKEQIRLIQLQKRTPKGPHIQCKLQVFDLKDAPPYTALSYRWGDHKPNCEIIINGGLLSIRQNLHDFLVQYQEIDDKGDIPLHMWIDQISIHQSNIAERNHQVQFMSNIYRQSRRVLVWLGRQPKLTWPPSNLEDMMNPSLEPEIERAICFAHATAFNKSRRWEHLQGMLENPYFDRLWIVQEVLLAKSISVLTGDVWLSWDAMHTCANIHYQNTRLRIARHKIDLLRMSGTERKGSLLPREFVESFSTMLCSDPRDKIYGMMGMIDSRYKFMVDYTRSIEGVFEDIATVMLDQEERQIAQSFYPLKMAIPHILENVARLMGLSDPMTKVMDIVIARSFPSRCIKQRRCPSDVELTRVPPSGPALPHEEWLWDDLISVECVEHDLYDEHGRHVI